MVKLLVIGGLFYSSPDDVCLTPYEPQSVVLCAVVGFIIFCKLLHSPSLVLRFSFEDPHIGMATNCRHKLYLRSH